MVARAARASGPRTGMVGTGVTTMDGTVDGTVTVTVTVTVAARTRNDPSPVTKTMANV